LFRKFLSGQREKHGQQKIKAKLRESVIKAKLHPTLSHPEPEENRLGSL